MITSEQRERFEENFETEPLEELAADAKAHPIIDDRPAFGDCQCIFDLFTRSDVKSDYDCGGSKINAS